uniref:DUF1725 domain-containing protein n=1 Tax=Sus scrofa TaxID=9823 RepID=A0A8D0Z5E3_PIG
MQKKKKKKRKKETCTHMFIAAVFPIAKTWKQPKCSLTDEWIKKMWYTYTMDYYSATKKNEIMPFTAPWMQLEILTPSEVSQKEKDKDHMIVLICGILNMAQMNLSTKQKQTHRHGEQTCSCQGGDGREWGGLRVWS